MRWAKLVGFGLVWVSLLFSVVAEDMVPSMVDKVQAERISALGHRVTGLEELKVGDRLARIETMQATMGKDLESIKNVMLTLMVGVLTLVAEAMVKLLKGKGREKEI